MSIYQVVDTLQVPEPACRDTSKRRLRPKDGQSDRRRNYVDRLGLRGSFRLSYVGCGKDPTENRSTRPAAQPINEYRSDVVSYERRVWPEASLIWKETGTAGEKAHRHRGISLRMKLRPTGKGTEEGRCTDAISNSSRILTT